MRSPSTSFTRLVGCRLPLQQAGMVGIASPALAAAVAREGGLGMIAPVGRSVNELLAQLDAAIGSAGEGGRVGVTFLMPFLGERALDAASATAAVVECFYGDPAASIVDRVHDGGALAAWQVGSLDEALAAADAGCDFLVVQGTEAGGHVRGTSPLLPLLREVRRACPVPLVAAGGIGSGEVFAAALDAGADAVRIGTRFVATLEADAHPLYVDALLSARAEDTLLTETFSLGWPHAPHRVLRRCIDASDLDPAFRSPLPPTASFAGDAEAAAFYAGFSVDQVREVVPAASVIRELCREASMCPSGPDSTDLEE